MKKLIPKNGAEMKSYSERLKDELDNIVELMIELINNSKIDVFYPRDNPDFIFFNVNNSWGEPTENEKVIQIKLKPLYRKWFELFQLLTWNLPEATQTKIEGIDVFIKKWIEKKSDSSIPDTIDEAKRKFISTINLLYEVLSFYEKSPIKTILIPDTNALLTKPDLKDYKTMTPTDEITVILIPTVLSELDKLKMKSMNQDFQNKVKSVISRIKGYRQQGNLHNGVTIEKTVCLKMIATEPNFSKTLAWLDRENNDDRIIASTLEIQKENPSALLCIVTNDINLQNKAEMANLSYIDID